MLSRYPLVEAEAISLPRRALNEPRNLLRVQWMPKPETTITLWGTHLSIDSIERVQQMVAIQALAPADGLAFLLGDLNASLAQNDVQSLFQSGWIDVWSNLNGDAGSTFPSDRPTTRIDYILATPQSIGKVRSIDAPSTLASDHLPLIMEIDLSDA